MKAEGLLTEFVKKAIIIAEKTGEFTIEQAPSLLKEFYDWYIISDIFFILFGIVIILCGRYIPHLWLHKEKKLMIINFFPDLVMILNLHGLFLHNLISQEELLY